MTLFSDDAASDHARQEQPGELFPPRPDPASGDPAPRLKRPRRVGGAVGWGLLIGAVAGSVVLGTLPAPYVIERPGPVYDTIGQVAVNGTQTPLITVSGAQTYPTTGALDMLTVYLDGTRQAPLSWLDLALAWFDPTRAVIPIDAVYPVGSTDQQNTQASTTDMANSQKEAVAAALTALNIPYTSVVTVSTVMAGYPAQGVLQAGDQILTADGAPINGVQALRAVFAAKGAGTPVTLGISRGGVASTVTVAAEISPDDHTTPVIGITTGANYQFPFTVDISLQSVGGPSAGMMLALGTYDKLTPGDLTGGQHIAGTGTITSDGTVGAIGGIRQKMYGARNAGATWFLAPASNCDEVVGHVPPGLTVFSVQTLKQAITTVQTIASGGDTSALATCSVPAPATSVAP